jgi:Fe-S-cluster-containing dehydrogenase component
MKRWYLVIDVEKCENCNNCFMACKDEHCGNDWPGYAASQPLHGHRWMNIRRKERGQFPVIDAAYLPTPCMHCDDPPCQRAAKNGAVIKRPDGIVLIDPQKARGQKALVQSCPYGAIWWNEEQQIPQKCTFCAHLLDSGWTGPRCVQACPTGALSCHFLEEKKMKELIASQGLENLERGKAPGHTNVYYRNLHRFQKCFIAGSLATGDVALLDCAAGATVKLYQSERLLDKAVSDDFGDFKFDDLPPHSGSYRIEIEYQANVRKEIDVDLEESCSVGTVWL